MAGKSIRELLNWGKAELLAKEISAVDAELLLAHVLGISRMQLHAKTIELEGSERERVEVEFEEAIAQRIGGRPTQYIVGTAAFRYLELAVGEGVLIPRPETELLVDEVLHNIATREEPVSIIDLGAGSGAIALALETECAEKKRVHVIAVENSPAALVWLHRNIQILDLPTRVVEASVVDALPGVRADVVVANPPYIPDGQLLTADVQSEPASALFGGSEDGMAIPGQFIVAAARLLKPGGFFAIEHHEEQGAAIAGLLQSDFEQIRLHQDLAERPRFTTAIRK